MSNDGATPIGEQNDRPDEYVPDGVSFTLEDVLPGRPWRHYRYNDRYITQGVARWSTNGPDEGKAVVLYHSAISGKTCARFADEFLDGRFRPIDLEVEIGSIWQQRNKSGVRVKVREIWRDEGSEIEGAMRVFYDYLEPVPVQLGMPIVSGNCRDVMFLQTFVRAAEQS